MENLFSAIASVKDPATRAALTLIAEELKRIRSVQPAIQDTRSLAIAVNKITGKL